MMQQMVDRIGDDEAVAVVYADCLSPGRFRFNHAVKALLVGRIPDPLAADGEVPPWRCLYGLGEPTPSGGADADHNDPTAVNALVR